MYRLIRLTSPTLNYFICCGALMLYISVYFYAIHSTESDIATILCNVSQLFVYLFYVFCTTCKKYTLFFIFLPCVIIIQLRVWIAAIGYSLAFGPVFGQDVASVFHLQ